MFHRIKIDEYADQKKRVLWCLVELLHRPLVRGEDALVYLDDFALTLLEDDEHRVIDDVSILSRCLPALMVNDDKI